MKTLGLLVGTVCSSFAMAAGTATAPRPMVRMSEPVQVKPVEVKPNAPVMNGEVVGKPAPAMSLEAFKAQEAAKAANSNTAPAVTCNNTQFAHDLADGTRFQDADAAYVIGQELITTGNCAGGVTKYDVEARENFIAASLTVAEELHGKKFSDLNDVEKAGLDTTWAKGIATAKNFKAANDNKVSVASQVPVARKIKVDCALRN